MIQLTVADVDLLPLYLRRTIPPEYLDEFGHMNVRWYVSICSDAVKEMFSSFGMTPEYFSDGTRGSFALKQYIHYLAEVRVGETIEVRTRVIGRTEKRIHFMHFILNRTNDKIAATMEVLAAHADLTVRRTSPFPEAIARGIDAALTAHSGLSWEPPVSGVIKA